MIGIVADKRFDGANGRVCAADLIRYVLQVNKQIDGEVIRYSWFENIFEETAEGAISEMRYVISLSDRTRHPLEHFILSWPGNEVPRMDLIHAAGKYVLKSMGLEKNQAVMALHEDTNNLHLHIVANRLDEDGNLVRTGNGWPINTIHKASRELELKNNWTHQDGGIYEIKKGLVVKFSGEKNKISKAARDFETFSGEASEQRKLQMICGNVMRKAKTWREMHENLAKHGITLKPKGSGGLLIVNDIQVKLSSIGREFSWGNLKKKMGEYEPPAWGEGLTPVEPEKSSIMVGSLPLMQLKTWPQYNEERKEHYKKSAEYRKERGKIRKELLERHRKKFKDWVDRANKERREIINNVMLHSQKRKEFNLLETEQEIQFSEIKRKIEQEAKKFKQEWSRSKYQKFPSYLQWLDFKKGNKIFDDDYASYYNRRNMGMIEPSAGGQDVDSETSYLIAGQVAFVDYGRLVKIIMETEDAILAAMELGKAKWGKIKITGDLEFKRKCYEITRGNGLKGISNKAFDVIFGSEDIERVQSMETETPVSIEAEFSAPSEAEQTEPGDDGPSGALKM